MDLASEKAGLAPPAGGEKLDDVWPRPRKAVPRAQERLTPASDLNLSTPTDNRGYQSISSSRIPSIPFLWHISSSPASHLTFSCCHLFATAYPKCAHLATTMSISHAAACRRRGRLQAGQGRSSTKWQMESRSFAHGNRPWSSLPGVGTLIRQPPTLTTFSTPPRLWPARPAIAAIRQDDRNDATSA